VLGPGTLSGRLDAPGYAGRAVDNAAGWEHGYKAFARWNKCTGWSWRDGTTTWPAGSYQEGLDRARPGPSPTVRPGLRTPTDPCSTASSKTTAPRTRSCQAWPYSNAWGRTTTRSSVRDSAHPAQAEPPAGTVKPRHGGAGSYQASRVAAAGQAAGSRAFRPRPVSPAWCTGRCRLFRGQGAQAMRADPVARPAQPVPRSA